MQHFIYGAPKILFDLRLIQCHCVTLSTPLITPIIANTATTRFDILASRHRLTPTPHRRKEKGRQF